MSEQIIYSGRPVCCAAPGQYMSRTSWKITTQYIEKTAGICCKSIDNLQLLRVKDIEFRGGCCCCGCCGTIHIMSTDTTSPELFISGIPDGKTVYHKIRDAVGAIQGSARLELNQ